MADGPFPWSGSLLRRMNGTPAEFRRALGQAFGDAASDDTNGVLLSVGSVQIHFTLQSEAAQKIGALQLPVLRVEVEVRRGSDEAAQSLLARVDRATLRGGG